MILYKIVFHIKAIIKKILLKIIYKRKIIIGKKVTFRKSFYIFIENNGLLRIGNNCFFNNYCSINVHKSVSIGSDCIFGENVKIYDHNHIFKYKNKLIRKQGFKLKEVKIGDNCWIGSNVIILKGVTIGDNCVIAAGQVVKRDVASNKILENGIEKDIEFV